MSTMSQPIHESRDHEAIDLLERACDERNPAEASRMRQQVVVLHRGLAIGLARRYEGRGIEIEDLEQVAMLGLVLAVRRYRPERGHGFTAYAAPTINGELKRYFRDHGWAVRPPRGVQELHQRVRGATSLLQQRLQREPTIAEIAAEGGVAEDEVRSARAAGASYRSTSLDQPVRADGDASLGDLLAAGTEDPVERSTTLISLRAAMEQELDERERRIISLRFGADLTQSEIGERIGVSQMQVSRLISGICRRLRQRLEA